MPRTYMGIDVGKNGGIAILYGSGRIETKVTPLIGKGKGSEINKQEIKELFKELNKETRLVAVLEDVHSIFGTSAGSNFQFGRSLGILEGLLEALDIPYYKVAPKTWQAVCFEGVPVIEKAGTKAKGKARYDNKAMALVATQRLYPQLDLRKSNKAIKAHDGIVDALLIAHYAKVRL